MPPSGFSKNAIDGALLFIKTCYEDLLEDVRSGKFQTYEEAIEHELKQIREELERLKIPA